ncbi:unnamed protein product [Vitrella brassicaformis CCMP3155]|uniref:RBR-type E3 ubiquitin transferase n=1 Tax=Vitrella brassicaformis (strain CCMP3155) TaxID=1169540 RepID=A0A0G4F8L7_VITBC|nr:unnamed protein product [Vitrella brassicaformis CCMP3155]|eukprot:CEM08887.1 unnamed protein product [Vitrella brassicaformis CCMP3155]
MPGEFRRDEVIIQRGNTPDGDFINNAAPCPECPGVLLTEPQRSFCVGSQDWANREQELRDEEEERELATILESLDSEELQSTSREFECMICRDDRHVGESTEMDCGHRICNDCFARYVKSKVDEAKVSTTELRCPGFDSDGQPCAMGLSVPQIMGALCAADREKYLRYRFDQWEPLDEGEIKVTCPAPNCATFIIDKTLKKVKYPKCNKEFCPHCSENAHDGTCEQYQQWKLDNNHGEQAFNRIAAPERWKSRQCMARGGTYFCYLCGQRLTQDEGAPMLTQMPRFDKTMATWPPRLRQDLPCPPFLEPLPPQLRQL